MLTRSRTFSLRKAGICRITAGTANIIIQLLVISKIIPYLWVNGGRAGSLAAARQASIVSIGITVVSILSALVASRMVPIRLNKFWKIFLLVFSLVTLPLSLLSAAAQLLGTAFERSVTWIIALAAFCADVRLASGKR